MFIPKILKITDLKARFLQDRTALLRDIVKAVLLRIPFQNATTFGAIPLLERVKPSMNSVMESCLRGGGGLCGHTNYFIKMVLDSIGYETQILSGVFRRTGIPNSHLAFLVRIPYTKPIANLLEGEPPKEKLYFVDVGCGVPIHEPILMGSLPYLGRAGGLDFRYELTKNGLMKRTNFNGDAMMGPKPSDFESPQDYTIDLTPKVKLGDFDEGFAQVYRNYDTIYLHQGFYLFRYLDISENDFKVVWIRGKELIFATRETRTAKTFEDFQQLQPIIHEYFPMINPREIELSIQNFTRFQSERGNRVAKKN